MAEADLTKIINIIMENPKLVSEIRDMVTKSESETDSNEVNADKETKTVEDTLPSSSPVTRETTYRESRSSRRNDLLRAMRPYVSEERGEAIESMITIMDILFAIKEK